MKQEVEERKQLEQQRKQVEKEEAKYIGEINKVKELLLITDNQDKLSQLNNKIEELQRQLFDVEQKKDDIIKRQNGKGISGTFTVRKVSFGCGVERTFPLHSPVIEKIEVTRRGKVRRAKLNYIRSLSAKAARIKERR